MAHSGEVVEYKGWDKLTPRQRVNRVVQGGIAFLTISAASIFVGSNGVVMYGRRAAGHEAAAANATAAPDTAAAAGNNAAQHHELLQKGSDVLAAHGSVVLAVAGVVAAGVTGFVVAARSQRIPLPPTGTQQ